MGLGLVTWIASRQAWYLLYGWLPYNFLQYERMRNPVSMGALRLRITVLTIDCYAFTTLSSVSNKIPIGCLVGYNMESWYIRHTCPSLYITTIIAFYLGIFLWGFSATHLICKLVSRMNKQLQCRNSVKTIHMFCKL